MLTDLKVLDTMSALTRHSAQRHTVIAENIANADTPGYQAKDITPFSDMYSKAMSEHRPVAHMNAQSTVMDSGQTASANGNSVSLEQQMMLSSEVKGTHDMALAVYKKSLDMMRMAVGKNL